MRNLLLAIAACLACGAVVVLIAGGILTAPKQTSVGQPPADLNAERVLISRPDGGTVSGWFVASEKRYAAVLLLHGVRANRLQMLDRARFLQDAGYDILMIDLQAHGETLGHNITFGYLESRDAHAALSYLRSRLHGKPVAVLGVSLGGAAALLGSQPLQADALILESVYSSFERAIENRLMIRFGASGRYLAPLFLLQVEPRLHVSVAALSPLAAVQNITSPVMLIAGTEDKRTLPSETRALFSKAPSPKRLWMVRGAGHEDLHKHSKQAYEGNVLQFLREQLRQSNPKHFMESGA